MGVKWKRSVIFERRWLVVLEGCSPDCWCRWMEVLAHGGDGRKRRMMEFKVIWVAVFGDEDGRVFLSSLFIAHSKKHLF